MTSSNDHHSHVTCEDDTCQRATDKSSQSQNHKQKQRPVVLAKKPIQTINDVSNETMNESDIAITRSGSLRQLTNDISAMSASESDNNNSLEGESNMKNFPQVRTGAKPPNDDADGYKLVLGRISPVSIICEEFDDYVDEVKGAIITEGSERVCFTVTAAAREELTIEVPTTPIETLSWTENAMQCSVRIEPSPERTLEMPKKKKPPRILRPSSRSAGEEEDEICNSSDGNRKRTLPPPGTIHMSKSADSMVELVDTAAPAATEIESKLNSFFGESRRGFTELETSVYKTLEERERSKHHENFSMTHNDAMVVKTKKAPTAYLASKFTSLSSLGQLKQTTKKSGSSTTADREPSMSKPKNRKTWRGTMARTFRRHVSTSSDDVGANTAIVGTFGVPLEACPISSATKFVPLIVEVCVTIVEELGATSQGIYRVPGHTGSVNELVDAVNHGDPACICIDENERWGDVNVVASLLKLFFRRLPEALTTDALYEALISAVRAPGNREKASLRLKRTLRELPEQNYVTLHYIVRHLAHVAAHQHVNKMDAHNLAIMFGPSLVRPRIEKMVNMVRDIDDQSCIIERLIQNCDWYFGDWNEEASVPPDSLQSEPSSMSSGSNLQLLANAESLVALQLAQDAAAAAPSDDALSSFFGSHRQSRKNKNKSEKETNDATLKVSTLPELNREVELRRIIVGATTAESFVSPSVAGKVKVSGETAQLTSVDLARKLSMSAKNKSKVKRRNTERPTANVIYISYEPPPMTDTLSGVSFSAKSNLTDSTAPDAVPEIKRYPAYNFVDTTIKLDKTSSSSLRRPIGVAAVSSEILHPSSPLPYSSSSLASMKRSAVANESLDRLEDWPSSDGSPEVKSSGHDEEVFSSTQFSSTASISTRNINECAFKKVSSSQAKRFSETDASKYFQPSVMLESESTPLSISSSVDVANALLMTQTGSKVKKYDVMIRTPEGRKYYVLSTSRPSVFFSKSPNIAMVREKVPGVNPVGVYAETLQSDQVLMKRSEHVGSLQSRGSASSSASLNADDIELRRFVSLDADVPGSSTGTSV